MSDSKLNDEIFDALLKEALSQLEEEQVKEKNRELEQIDTSDYVPSKKFLRNLRREYFRYSVKNTLKSKALRKVASFVLMTGLVSGGLCFWAEANGIPVYETIFLRKERYTSIEVYNQIVSEEDESSLDYFYFPKYLPVDFQVVEEVSQKSYSRIRFKNEDQFFCISQWITSLGRQARLDTEDTYVEEIEIDGHEGFYSERNGKQFIYLNMGNISINIYGNIGKKELFRMARNLELLEKQVISD